MKLLAQATVFLAHLLDEFARVLITFAVGSDVDDAKVYADDALGCKGFRFCDCYRDREVKLSVPQEKVCLSALTAQEFLLPGRTQEREMQPSLYGVEADDLPFSLPCERIFVEFNTAEWMEGAQRVGIEL